MPIIHPTATVDPGAELAEDVVIGPCCYLSGQVVIGAGTRLISHVAVLGRTTLGQGNIVWPQAILGGNPQDRKYRGEDTQLIVGDHNEIRELVTMHIGTDNGGGVTRVGSHNLLMVGVHIAHDCLVGNHVTIANNSGLSGHVVVEDHANIAAFVGVHHFVTFGQYCYVGGMSRVVHDVPPFMIVEGDPAKVRGFNQIGMARHQFAPTSIEAVKESYRLLFHKSAEDRGVGCAVKNLPEVERLYAHDAHVAQLIQFVRRSLSGLQGRYRESLRQDNRRSL